MLPGRVLAWIGRHGSRGARRRPVSRAASRITASSGPMLDRGRRRPARRVAARSGRRCASRGASRCRPGPSGRRHASRSGRRSATTRMIGPLPSAGTRRRRRHRSGSRLRSPTWSAGVAARRRDQAPVQGEHRVRVGALRGDVPCRRVGPEPQPRTAGREPGARARRSTASACGCASDPTSRSPGRPGPRADRRSPSRRHVDVAQPELLAVVQERRPAQGQEQDRGGAWRWRRWPRHRSRPPAAMRGAAGRGSTARPSASASAPNAGLALGDRGPDRGGRPRRSEQLPVEDEVAIGREAGGGLDRAVEQLADGHPAGRLVEDRPEAADELREVGLVAVVEVDLPVPGRVAPARVGLDGSSGCLRKVLNTSSRNPSTPRSSQPRTIANWAASTPGVRQFSSGCSTRNVW